MTESHCFILFLWRLARNPMRTIALQFLMGIKNS
jgi:hypothetical protein